jgi:hypothetical protein
LADKLPDTGNAVGAGLIVGQAVSGQMFSTALALVGIAVWVSCFVAAVALAAPEDQS